jgi:hypothetical protein
VVLADHFVAEELQHPRHAVADDGRAQVADVHLLGQVRRRQVDHGALRRAGLAHAVASARAASRREARAWVFWKKLRKPGPAISALLTLSSAGSAAMIFRQIARLHAGRLGQHHGDVAGEVAVGLVAGVFHLDRRRQAFRQHTFVDELGEGLLDQLANGVFHGLLFRPQARRRIDAQVEKLGIIRCEDGLANLSSGYVVTQRHLRQRLSQYKSTGSTSSDQRTWRPLGICSSTSNQLASSRCSGARAWPATAARDSARRGVPSAPAPARAVRCRSAARPASVRPRCRLHRETFGLPRLVRFGAQQRQVRKRRQAGGAALAQACSAKAK